VVRNEVQSLGQVEVVIGGPRTDRPRERSQVAHGSPGPGPEQRHTSDNTGQRNGKTRATVTDVTNGHGLGKITALGLKGQAGKRYTKKQEKQNIIYTTEQTKQGIKLERTEKSNST